MFGIYHQHTMTSLCTCEIKCLSNFVSLTPPQQAWANELPALLWLSRGECKRNLSKLLSSHKPYQINVHPGQWLQMISITQLLKFPSNTFQTHLIHRELIPERSARVSPNSPLVIIYLRKQQPDPLSIRHHIRDRAVDWTWWEFAAMKYLLSLLWKSSAISHWLGPRPPF